MSEIRVNTNILTIMHTRAIFLLYRHGGYYSKNSHYRLHCMWYPAEIRVKHHWSSDILWYSYYHHHPLPTRVRCYTFLYILLVIVVTRSHGFDNYTYQYHQYNVLPMIYSPIPSYYHTHIALYPYLYRVFGYRVGVYLQGIVSLYHICSYVNMII